MTKTNQDNQENQDKAFNAVAEQSRALAITTDALTQEQLLLSEKVGVLKAFDFVGKMLTVSTIKMLAEIKETKQYKGLRVFDRDGKLLTVSSWAEFCNSLGVSRQKVDLDIQNLSVFGEDFLETSQKMGVGYRDLRKLRQLPDDEREVIINNEAVQLQDKESILELIEDMSVKHKKEKEALEKQIADEKAERQATDKVIGNKNKKIDELEKQLARKETASPFDRATEYAQEVAKLETAMLTTFGDIDRLFQCIGEDAELPAVLRVNQGQLLSQLKYHADTLINKYQLGDISVDDEQLDWVAEMQKDKADGNVPEYITTGVA